MRKKVIIGIAIVLIIIVSAGYYFKVAHIGIKNNVPNNLNGQIYKKPISNNSKNSVLDKEMSDKLLKEPGVHFAQIYVSDRQAFASIVSSSSLVNEQSTSVNNKYAQLLKNKYPDKVIIAKTIDINGKELAYKEIK